MRATSVFRSLAVALLAGVMAACATSTENIQEQGGAKAALAAGEESIVVGRIRWLENGEERKIGSGMFQFSISPVLLRMEDRSKIKTSVDENGAFAWALKPGIYVINRINYRDPWSGNYFMVPKVAFRVSEKGKLYYVGTLMVDFKPKRDLIGGLSGEMKIAIRDQSPEDEGVLTRNLGVDASVEKSLMIHDRDLPSTIDTTQEYQMTLQILNALFFGLPR